MPAIPAMPSPTGYVDPAWIYQNGVFLPANPPATFEILNGGLDATNLGVATLVPTYAIQLGAFARGYYWGFDHWEFTYARQFSQDPSLGSMGESLRVVHAGLSCVFVLPWVASCVWFAWQAYCRDDATVWSIGTDPPTAIHEWWDLYTKYDDTPLGELHSRLPPTRSTANLPAVGAGAESGEDRFRWVTKMGLSRFASWPTHCAKGLHRISISVWPKVEAPDVDKEKIVTSAGGLWVMAFR